MGNISSITIGYGVFLEPEKKVSKKKEKRFDQFTGELRFVEVEKPEYVYTPEAQAFRDKLIQENEEWRYNRYFKEYEGGNEPMPIVAMNSSFNLGFFVGYPLMRIDQYEFRGMELAKFSWITGDESIALDLYLAENKLDSGVGFVIFNTSEG